MNNQTQYEYADYLSKKSNRDWKRVLDVQAPYRWHIRQLKPGFILDIGCGVGRNLAHVQGYGVGIDINPYCVQITQKRGFNAFGPEEFKNSEYNRPARFDSILVSHVLEHMTFAAALILLQEWLPFLRPEGHLILLTPQEAGFRAEPTHVEFMDFARLQEICCQLALTQVQQYSFPFPRWLGNFFKYNEFVFIAKNPRSRPTASNT